MYDPDGQWTLPGDVALLAKFIGAMALIMGIVVGVPVVGLVMLLQ